MDIKELEYEKKRQEAESRVILLARKWAAFMLNAEVLSMPSHRLLKAVQKLNKLESK